MDTKIEPEVQRAIECIRSKTNFIMEGGAGSGKTRSLSEVIGELVRDIQIAEFYV